MVENSTEESNLIARPRLYLAGRYSRKEELKSYVPLLEANGFEVLTNWLKEKADSNIGLDEMTNEECEDTSNVDLTDIQSVEAMLFFAEDPLTGTPRGGRHVEFGYALALKKPIFVVGPKENIFHWQPYVTHFESIEDFVDALGVRE